MKETGSQCKIFIWCCSKAVGEWILLKWLLNEDYEESKSRLNLRNTCYYSFQNVLPSRLLSKNVKIKIHKTIILPVVLYGCETWSLTQRKDLDCKCLKTGC